MSKKKKDIRDTLRGFVTDHKTSFHWYHNIERLKKINELSDKSKDDDESLKYYEEINFNHEKAITDFLDSTLDEARLKKANDFAEYALYISDKRSFAYFRRAESKREMSGEIDYAKHRDHAVHTLYNYLLGWYIFEKLPKFQQNFKAAFTKILSPKWLALYSDDSCGKPHEKGFYDNDKNEEHLLKDSNGKPDKSEDGKAKIALINHFGDVWSMASLLHDVGYILEGSLSSATSEIEHVRVTNGAKVLHDYFNHWAWKSLQVDFRAARWIAGLVGCKVPDFKSSRSLPSLGDHLRDIGRLENVRKKCNVISLVSLKLDEPYALNREAFSIWDAFYTDYGFDSKSKDILSEVKKEYLKDVWEGGATSQRSLNHGVCGGLILLQAATFWYEWLWGLQSAEWCGIAKKQKRQEKLLPAKSGENISETVFQEIKEKTTNKRIPAHIQLRGGIQYSDWMKELWATASVAIHDYVTKDTWNVGNRKDKNLTISLENDPLAYLQILVDTLQEWDRYTVMGESAFSGAELLQSYETRLYFDSKNEKIKISYPKRDSVKKQYCSGVDDALNGILDSWDKHVNTQ